MAQADNNTAPTFCLTRLVMGKTRHPNKNKPRPSRPEAVKIQHALNVGYSTQSCGTWPGWAGLSQRAHRVHQESSVQRVCYYYTARSGVDGSVAGVSPTPRPHGESRIPPVTKLSADGYWVLQVLH